jgi:hypothetical protein
MTTKYEPEERVVTPTFSLYGMPFVPHYTKPYTYVAPGGFEATADTLTKLGAVQQARLLWRRYWIEVAA